jgi:predicted nucleic acid-binding protein
MILIDTSIWIDHLRSPDQHLSRLLGQRLVLTHPFVVGELAVGHLRDREGVLGNLERLSKARTATDAEVLSFIERNRLWGRGIGYVDAHLLVATKLSEFASFWTTDKRLAKLAEDLGLAHVV